MRVAKGMSANRADPIAETEYWREATKPRFWEQILEQRAALLQDITVRLTENSDTSPLPSLEAAKQRLADLNPTEFVSFMERWLISLAEWSDRLSVLSQVDLVDKARAIEKALAELGLAHVVGGDDDVVPKQTPPSATRWIGDSPIAWVVGPGLMAAADSGLRTSRSGGQRVMAGVRCSVASNMVAVRAAVCSAQRLLVTRPSTMIATPQPASSSQPR